MQCNNSTTPDANSVHTINREKARKGTRLLLESMGIDPEAEHIRETWERRVPKTIETLSAGLREAEKPKMRTFPAGSEELVVKSGIPLYSLCEHHLLPFHGVAHVAYRPGDEVVGLSKLARYVRWQARKPTMQERLTQEIATELREEVDASGVLVETTAMHLCEAMRGVETASKTTTRSSAGELSTDDHRQFERAIDRTTD